MTAPLILGLGVLSCGGQFSPSRDAAVREMLQGCSEMVHFKRRANETGDIRL